MAVRFSSGAGAKNRPAVVVSVDAFHQTRADALVVPLTSNLTQIRFGDCLLVDWQSAGLLRPTLAKGVIETVERGTFQRILGTMSATDLATVENELRGVLVL